MKKIYTHKILPILAIFLFILFVFSSNVFATSVTELSTDDINTMVQRGYDVIEENGYNPSDFTKYFIRDIGICYFTDNSSIVIGSASLVKVKNNCCVWFDFDTLEPTEFANNMENQIGNPWDLVYTRNIYYSSFTITSGNNVIFEKNIDFFHQTPQGITATLVEEAMKAKILEQLKIMIVGFLKYLIVFVISVIAFWKGWQFLSMQLKKA